MEGVVSSPGAVLDIDDIPLPAIVLSDTGRIEAVNVRFSRETGWSRRDLPDLYHWSRLCERRDVSSAEACLPRLLDVRHGATQPIELWSAAGKTLRWQATCGPVRASPATGLLLVAGPMHGPSLHEPLADAQLDAVVQASDDAIFLLDLDRTVATWNGSAQRMFGYTAREIIGRPVATMVPPDRASENALIGAGLERHGSIRLVTQRRHRDGRLLDLELRLALLHREGEPAGISVVARDLAEELAVARDRRTADLLIRRQADRLDAILRTMPFSLFLLDGDGETAFINDAGRRLAGIPGAGPPPSVAQLYEMLAISKDGRRLSREELGFVRLLAGQPVGVEDLSIRCADGIVRQFRRRVGLVGGDPSGGALVVLEDVTEALQRDLVNMALLEEIRHRSRNLLSIVQTIVRQAVREPGGKADMAEAIVSRLQALGRAQNLLAASGRAEVTLDDLARSQLAHLEDEAHRIRTAGPPVLVRSDAAQALGMCLHELSTNAVKHGALSAPGGSVLLQWSIEPGPEGEVFEISWRETGGPPVDHAPTRTGFGQTILVRIAPQALGGTAECLHEASGLVWRLRAALRRVTDDPVAKPDPLAARMEAIVVRELYAFWRRWDVESDCPTFAEFDRFGGSRAELVVVEIDPADGSMKTVHIGEALRDRLADLGGEQEGDILRDAAIPGVYAEARARRRPSHELVTWRLRTETTRFERLVVPFRNESGAISHLVAAVVIKVTRMGD